MSRVLKKIGSTIFFDRPESPKKKAKSNIFSLPDTCLIKIFNFCRLDSDLLVLYRVCGHFRRKIQANASQLTLISPYTLKWKNYWQTLSQVAVDLLYMKSRQSKEFKPRILKSRVPWIRNIVYQEYANWNIQLYGCRESGINTFMKQILLLSDVQIYKSITDNLNSSISKNLGTYLNLPPPPIPLPRSEPFRSRWRATFLKEYETKWIANFIRDNREAVHYQYYFNTLERIVSDKYIPSKLDCLLERTFKYEAVEIMMKSPLLTRPIHIMASEVEYPMDSENTSTIFFVSLFTFDEEEFEKIKDALESITLDNKTKHIYILFTLPDLCRDLLAQGVSMKSLFGFQATDLDELVKILGAFLLQDVDEDEMRRVAIKVVNCLKIEEVQDVLDLVCLDIEKKSATLIPFISDHDVFQNDIIRMGELADEVSWSECCSIFSRKFKTSESDIMLLVPYLTEGNKNLNWNKYYDLLSLFKISEVKSEGCWSLSEVANLISKPYFIPVRRKNSPDLTHFEPGTFFFRLGDKENTLALVSISDRHQVSQLRVNRVWKKDHHIYRFEEVLDSTIYNNLEEIIDIFSKEPRFSSDQTGNFYLLYAINSIEKIM